MPTKNRLPFAQVPYTVCQDDRLSPKQLRVLFAVLSFQTYSGVSFYASRKQISERCGIPETRISTVTSQLSDLGYLIKSGQRGPGKKSLYTFFPYSDSGQRKEVRSHKKMGLKLRKWQSIRENVLERDGYTCQYCGKSDAKLECDHIFPSSRGGSDNYDNLTTACSDCNQSKRDKTIAEWLE